jgi:hypothetical protein
VRETTEIDERQAIKREIVPKFTEAGPVNLETALSVH